MDQSNIIILVIICMISLSLSISIGVGIYLYMQQQTQPIDVPETSQQTMRSSTPTEPKPTSTPNSTPAPVTKALDNYNILKDNDYPGNDIKCYDDGKSTEECAKLCNDDKSCVGLVEVPKNSVWGEKSGCCIKNKFGNRSTIDKLNFYYKKDQTLPVEAPPFKPNYQAIKSRLRDNFCLAIGGGIRDSGPPLITWTCLGGDEQKFMLDDNQRLVMKHSGKCVDVAGGRGDNGTPVIQWDCHDGANQKWEYDTQGRLHPKHAADKCLTINDNSDKDGANMSIHQCGDGNNQKWFL